MQHEGVGAGGGSHLSSGGLPPPVARGPAVAAGSAVTGALGVSGGGEGSSTAGAGGLPPPHGKIGVMAGCVPTGLGGAGATSAAANAASVAAAATVDERDLGAAGRMRSGGLGQAPGQQGQLAPAVVAVAGAGGAARQHSEVALQISSQDGLGSLADGAAGTTDAYEEFGVEGVERPSQEESLRALQVSSHVHNHLVDAG